MPWEVTIVNAAERSKPLGSRANVITNFAQALPGVDFRPAPGPSPEVIAQMPIILQEHYATRKQQLNADFEGNGFSIQFYATDAAMIQDVGAEIRGDGNPLPTLSALCVSNGWAVIDAASGDLVKLSAAQSPDWAQFVAWRDKAIGSIKARGTTGE